MRASTAYFIMGNDYAIYQQIENEGIDNVTVDLKLKLKLTDADWAQILIWYKEEHDEGE